MASDMTGGDASDLREDDEESLTKGPWKRHEDEMLLRLIRQYGISDWSEIAAHMPKRSGKSCRLRWHNQLDPNVNRGPFQPHEDEQILRSHARHGNKWSLIARTLTNRTDNAVKNRFNSTLKKRIGSDSYRLVREEEVNLGRPSHSPLLSKSVLDAAEIVHNMSKTIVPGTTGQGLLDCRELLDKVASKLQDFIGQEDLGGPAEALHFEDSPPPLQPAQSNHPISERFPVNERFQSFAPIMYSEYHRVPDAAAYVNRYEWEQPISRSHPGNMLNFIQPERQPFWHHYGRERIIHSARSSPERIMRPHPISLSRPPTPVRQREKGRNGSSADIEDSVLPDHQPIEALEIEPAYPPSHNMGFLPGPSSQGVHPLARGPMPSQFVGRKRVKSDSNSYLPPETARLSETDTEL